MIRKKEEEDDPRSYYGLGAVFATIGLAIVLGGLFLFSSAPLPMTLDEIADVKSADNLKQRYVTITFDEVEEANVGVDTYKGFFKESSTRIILIRAKDRWLIAEVPERFQGTRITGLLTKLKEYVREKIVYDIKTEMKDRRFVGLELDGTKDYFLEGLGVMGIGLVFLGVAGYMVYVGSKTPMPKPKPKPPPKPKTQIRLDF